MEQNKTRQEQERNNQCSIFLRKQPNKQTQLNRTHNAAETNKQKDIKKPNNNKTTNATIKLLAEPPSKTKHNNNN